MTIPLHYQVVADFKTLESLSSCCMIMERIFRLNKDKLDSHDQFWLNYCIEQVGLVGFAPVPSDERLEEYIEEVRKWRVKWQDDSLQYKLSFGEAQ